MCAAFNIMDGTVISEIHRQQWAVEFMKFLVAIDKTVPARLDAHLVCANLATHMTLAIAEWLARHPRSTCTSRLRVSSWIKHVHTWIGLRVVPY